VVGKANEQDGKIKEKNVMLHILGELRMVARCGLGTNRQPDTAVGTTDMTKEKGQGFLPW